MGMDHEAGTAPARGRALRALACALRALACALVVGASLITGPAGAPSSVVAIGPLPECRLDDILTVPRDYDSWSTTLVDWLLSVGKDYKPPDLVSVRTAGLTGSGYVRKVAIDDLRALAKAAAKNGTPIGSWSAYRIYDQQVELFNGYVKAYGYDNAIEFSHRPGHSEHQLGLAIDFMASGANGMLSGSSATGKWMAKNAWKYGWLLSYPPSKTDPSHLWNETVCFRSESWHYRYLGRDLAAKVHDSGLTIREYLWTNFTMVDPETGEALPTATIEPPPTVTPSPTASSTASASPSEALATAAGGTPPVGGSSDATLPIVFAGLLVVLVGLGFLAWRASTIRQARRRAALLGDTRLRPRGAGGARRLRGR